MPQNLSAAFADTAAAVFTDATLHKAADLAADPYRSAWTGPSGEESSGEAVARHLEATIALLNQDGWVRAYDYGKDWTTGANLADDDSKTVKEMVRALLRLVREASGTDPHRTLDTALRHVGDEGRHGDSDTAVIASHVLDLMVRAHTGSDAARAVPWAGRQHRTHADITALLSAGAQFARTYGPGAAGDQEQAA